EAPDVVWEGGFGPPAATASSASLPSVASPEASDRRRMCSPPPSDAPSAPFSARHPRHCALGTASSTLCARHGVLDTVRGDAVAGQDQSGSLDSSWQPVAMMAYGAHYRSARS